jgi:hypothetical protein
MAKSGLYRRLSTGALAIVIIVTLSVVALTLASAGLQRKTMYVPKPNLSTKDFDAFAVVSESSKKAIGCALFRKSIEIDDGRWISIEVLTDHSTMILAPNYDRAKGSENIPLYIDDKEVMRKRRAGEYAAYYLRPSDYDEIKNGKSVKRAKNAQYFLLKSNELEVLDRVFEACVKSSLP